MSQQYSALVHAWYAGKQESPAASLTDVGQQLLEEQDITVMCTIHFHPWLHENHTSAPAPGYTTETDKQEHVYQKPVRDVNELKQQLIDTRSATADLH